MFLFYLDEHGESSMKVDPSDPKRIASDVSPYFTLSAVGIRDSVRKPFADALFETKKRHFGDSIEEAEWGDSEIKGRHLRRTFVSVSNGKVNRNPPAYSVIKTQRAAEHLFDDLGLLIAKFRPLIFTAIVDKQRLLTTRGESFHNPIGVAYALIHERIALALEKLYVGESAIIIADQQKQHEKFFREGGMNEMRNRVSAPLRVQPNFDLILDKPLWLDTDLSSWDRELLQIADMVAYSSATCVEDGRAPEASHYLWPQMKNSMAVHWRNGDVNQAGFTVFPRSATHYPET
ncbi:DUF3800 domain-containing protein [Leucobacter salsicius]|uniref:DUF3800 domain-containing protein n=1 Tax=Leucobacter salsicius TaxID=664638 RepID=UPI0003701F23|nr:DUF3800 domain-containing protein [Leucobacter salsicius]